MDPLQVDKNGKIFLLLDTEIGAVGRIASMAILPAGALLLINEMRTITKGKDVFELVDNFFNKMISNELS